MFEVILRRGIKGTSSWSFEHEDDALKSVIFLEQAYGRKAIHDDSIKRYIIDASDWEPNKRNKDALSVIEGACNPIPVARALHEAIQEMFKNGADTPTICGDPAVRLIAFQLSHLLKLHEIETNLGLFGYLQNVLREPHTARRSA